MSILPAGPRARVAIVINSLEGGGAERIVALLMREFLPPADPGFDVALVLLDERPQAYELPAGVTVTVLGAQGSLLRSTWNLLRYLRASGSDLVFSHLARANFATILCCRWLRRPCVIMEHVNTTSHFSTLGGRDRISRLLVRRLYPGADRVVAVSAGVSADLASNFAVPLERLEVIPTPFDIDTIRQSATAEPAAPLPEAFIVAVGRLTANKNFSLLLNAYAEAELPVDLVILGEGEERTALEHQSASLGIRERTHFLGFLRNPYAVMARARAFVSSSNAEGFPVAASEAMILGRPILMTDCPSGPADLLGGAAPPGAGLVEGKYGLLVPMGDTAAMVEGLRKVIDPSTVALVEAGKARMETFQPATIAARHARLIHAVWAQAAARRS